MEQRPLRLGDILDDYCPRERRVTNHAVVAMIEDTVKQTRCTTCDAEHPYKGGQAPRRRKKTETPLQPSLAAPDTSDDNLHPSDNGIGETPILVPNEVASEVVSEAASEEPLADEEPVLVEAVAEAT